VRAGVPECPTGIPPGRARRWHSGLKPDADERAAEIDQAVALEHASGIPETEHEQVRGPRPGLHAVQDATRFSTTWQAAAHAAWTRGKPMIPIASEAEVRPRSKLRTRSQGRSPAAKLCFRPGRPMGQVTVAAAAADGAVSCPRAAW
jgi:hypothetical protein